MRIRYPKIRGVELRPREVRIRVHKVLLKDGKPVLRNRKNRVQRQLYYIQESLTIEFNKDDIKAYAPKKDWCEKGGPNAWGHFFSEEMRCEMCDTAFDTHQHSPKECKRWVHRAMEYALNRKTKARRIELFRELERRIRQGENVSVTWG